jgi:flagella basal body P-ring formation protein FlgA
MSPDPRRRSSRRASANLLLPCLLLSGPLALWAILPACAQERTVPAPNQVIYPGDIIRSGMLTDVSVDDVGAGDGSLIDTRAALIGKVAKRTLLPGQAIAAIAVGNPKAVANGAEVKVIFREGALTIMTFALALEAGAVGDVIKVRNTDSGLTISGTVQPDGSVSVGDS